MNYPNPGFPPSVPPPRPSRPRPGRAGIWVGVVVLVLAVVAPLVLVLTVVVPAWDLDRRAVPADGEAHGLVLPANAEYAVFSQNSAEWSSRDPACRAATRRSAQMASSRPP
ncbi:hypothetical protein P1N98_02520, partial [Tsukamurella tyrosinosolvens]